MEMGGEILKDLQSAPLLFCAKNTTDFFESGYSAGMNIF